MKAGDLVKYIYPAKQFGPIERQAYGVITEVRSIFSSGGGGSWPESGYHVHVLWDDGSLSWVTNEYPFALEVVSESA